MYKKQMTFQRIICFLCIAAGVLVFLYALGMMTDLYDMLYNMIPYPDDPSSAKVEGAMIYYDMQGFNQDLLKAGIGVLLLAVLLMITGTHSRRKYYAANYTAVGLFTAACIAAAAWAHGQIAAYKLQYLTTVDFQSLERRLSRAGTYTDSTFWFDIHIAVFAVALIAAALLVLNTIWKIRLMKQEKKLIEAGKAVSA
jgi:hypothetical protein